MSHATRLTTLFLDAGGVLVHPNWGRVAEALVANGAANGEGAASLAARLRAAQPYAMRDLDRPQPIAATDDASRGRTLFDLALERVGVPRGTGVDAAFEALAEFQRTRNLWDVVPDGVPAALARLRSFGLTLVVVSNANGTLERLLSRVGLAPFFQHALDSAVEGVEKPDPRLFEIALARAGARPEETLHAGDLYHVDVVGARAAGIRAVLVDAADLRTEADCPRVRSLDELADGLAAGLFAS